VASSLDRARTERDGNPIEAEQHAADATLFWSCQHNTAWVVRASCYLRAGQIAEAYGCWAQVTRPRRAVQSDLLDLAELAVQTHEDRLADWANAAAARSMGDRRWLSQRVILSLRKQQWDQVVNESAELRKIAAEDGRSWKAIGDAEFALNRFPQAVDAYDRAATAQYAPLPSDQLEPLRARLTQLLVDLGEFERATPMIAAELQANPEDAAALRKQAVLLRSRGEIQPALETIQKAYRSAPNDERIRILFATLLIDAQQPEEAAEIFRRLIADRPFLAEARHRYAGLLRQQNAVDEALPHERESQRLRQLERDLLDRQSDWNASTSPATARKIAEILRELGRSQDARAWDQLAVPSSK
jgi:tetratricopeptide (TPR) repeat protein